eukprot:COSAG02_NODE_5631_length_4171_cov_4.971758_2_plen_104_part_00
MNPSSQESAGNGQIKADQRSCAGAEGVLARARVRRPQLWPAYMYVLHGTERVCPGCAVTLNSVYRFPRTQCPSTGVQKLRLAQVQDSCTNRPSLVLPAVLLAC